MRWWICPIILFSLTTSTQTQAHILRVSPSGSGSDGTTWQTAFPTISEALLASSTGDEIWVAAGTYQETIRPGSGVSIFGGFNGTEDLSDFDSRNWEANPSILDGTGCGQSVVTITNAFDVVLDGLSIINGSSLYGGGIHCSSSSLTIRNCRIAQNQASTEVDCQSEEGDWNYRRFLNCYGGCSIVGGLGGGIYCWNTSLTLASCLVASNTGTVGGGLYGASLSDVLITDSSFSENVALPICEYVQGTCCAVRPHSVECTTSPFNKCAGSYGGGILAIDTGLTIKASYINTNKAALGGGGIEAQGEFSTLFLEDCLINENTLEDTTKSAYKEGGGGIGCSVQDAMFLGCTFRGNVSNTIGGGMALSESATGATISDCTFEDNRVEHDYGEGGSLYVARFTDPVIDRTVFQGNTAHLGGGVYSEADPLFTGCSFQFNSANNGGGFYGGGRFSKCAFFHNYGISSGAALFGSGLDLTNCIIAYNSSPAGAAISGGAYGSLCSLVNCTVYHNSSESDATIIVAPLYSQESSLTVINSILWNAGAEVKANSWTCLHSDVQGGATGEGNIDLYPSFVDASNLDFTLLDGSPCIDSGASPASQDFQDYAGNPRISGPQIDMGALEAPEEFTPGSGLAPFTRFYVAKGGTSQGPGDSWDNAFDSITQALKRSHAGTAIWIMGGTYSENVLLENAITLYGGFLGSEQSLSERSLSLVPTVIKGVQTGKPVINGFGIESATLDGITVSGGSAKMGGGLRCEGPGSYLISSCRIQTNHSSSDGGGIHCSGGSKVKFQNCVISDNSAVRDGGGLFADKDTTIQLNDCMVLRNVARSGGGFSGGACSATITDSTFATNEVADSAGGAFISGTVAINSSLFKKNVSQKAAGGLHLGANSISTIQESTFSDNSSLFGGGVFVDKNATPSFRRCKFLGNHAFANGNLSPPNGSGAGIYSYYSIATLVECLIKGNSAEYEAGGLYGQYAAYNIMESTLSDNVGHLNGGFSLQYPYHDPTMSSVFANCLMVRNRATSENTFSVAGLGYLRRNASANFVNCTMVDNRAHYVGGIAGGVLGVTNCILWNQGEEIELEEGGVTYSCVQGEFIGQGNHSGLPLFRDWDNGDFRLGDNSPCIDRATPSGVFGELATDLDGKPRTQNGVMDSGCYEAPQGVTQGPSNVVFSPIFVQPNGAGKSTGKSWDESLPTIQEALRVSSTSSEIWVAEGIYMEPLILESGVSLYGGFTGIETSLIQRNHASHPTIIDAAEFQQSAVLVPSDSVVSLDGFIITGGNGYYGGGISCGRRSNSTLKNLIVSENYGRNGGGLYLSLHSDALLENSLIVNNSALTGAGLYSQNGDGLLIHCTLAANSATDNVAIYVGSLLSDPSMGIRNCVIWNEGMTEIPSFSQTFVTIHNSQVRQAVRGIGNNSRNPLFLDYDGGDFRLSEMSPCIDTAMPNLSLDSLNGVARPVDIPGVGSDSEGSAFDRGAYERPLGGFPTFTPTFTPQPTLTPSPTAILPFNLVPDGIVNANDLLTLLMSAKDTSTSDTTLFAFSAHWMTTANN